MTFHIRQAQPVDFAAYFHHHKRSVFIPYSRKDFFMSIETLRRWRIYYKSPDQQTSAEALGIVLAMTSEQAIDRARESQVADPGRDIVAVLEESLPSLNSHKKEELCPSMTSQPASLKSSKKKEPPATSPNDSDPK